MEVPAQRRLRDVYQVGRYEGSVHLFRATRQLTLHRELDYDLGWGAHLPEDGLKVITFPGDHFSLVRRPGVIEVAGTIQELIADADRKVLAEIDRETVQAQEYPPLPFAEPVHGEDLCRRFLQVTGACAEKTAIRDGGFRMTYAKLEAAARRIATYILEHDPEGTAPVMLHFENSWQFVSSLYGVLLAGRCYLPVDTDFPDLRIRDILEISGSRWALTMDPIGLKRIGGDGLTVHSFNDAYSHRGSPSRSLPVEAAPEADAILLFTSGSTGKPKGSTVSRKMLLHVSWRRGGSFELVPGDRYAIPYVSAFMGAAIAIHASILSGCTLCHFNLRRRGVAELPGWMREERITVLHIITSILRSFLVIWKGQPALPDLRLLIPGGERSRRSDIDLWKSMCSDKVRYATCLGSTECGTMAVNMLTMDYQPSDGPLPVGVPYAAIGLQILRDDGTPADPMEEGQLVVTSDYIFKGYLGLDELNRSILSLTVDGKRIYRSGDYGFLDESGMLYNCGRRDSRVKVRGTLVDLLEVESVIMDSGRVENVAVLHRPVRAGDEERNLVAFYQATSRDPDALEKELGNFLLQRLPKAMVPWLWVRISQFPRTVNGKTDRRALELREL